MNNETHTCPDCEKNIERTLLLGHSGVYIGGLCECDDGERTWLLPIQ